MYVPKFPTPFPLVEVPPIEHNYMWGNSLRGEIPANYMKGETKIPLDLAVAIGAATSEQKTLYQQIANPIPDTNWKDALEMVRGTLLKVANEIEASIKREVEALKKLINSGSGGSGRHS